MALGDKSKRVNMVFSLKDYDDMQLFEFKTALLSALSNVQAVRYAFILHDLDKVTNDQGEQVYKTPHVHLWLECKSSSRVSTYINKMAKALDINPLAVSCQVAVSDEGSIQYLIHKNDPDKHQYAISEIVSNIDKEELAIIMERPVEAFSVDFIINSYRSCSCFADFVKKVGIERYQKYRNVIKDIISF